MDRFEGRNTEDSKTMCPETNQKEGPAGNRPDSASPPRPGHLELYFFPDCPYCRKVLGAIDDLRLKDKVVFHDARSDPQKKEDLVKLTGKTQVPCLVVDGKPMHESEDIKKFLYQTYSG
jgi:glutaredoxin